MVQLTGEYYCKVDAKGRVRLPSSLLKQLGGLSSAGFVINRGFERCLVMYPRLSWETVTKDIRGKLNQYGKDNRKFIRHFFRGATEVDLDSNSRILLPKVPAAEYANITNEIVLFAYFDKIEIWSKETYEDMMNEEPSDYADFADKLMGNNSQDND